MTFVRNYFSKKNHNKIFEQTLTAEIDELQQKIQAVQTSKDRNKVHLEKGLFYSITTITETNTSQNSSLNENLQLAYEAMSYASRKIPYSSNFFNRENTLYNTNTMTSKELLNQFILFAKAREKLVETKHMKNLTKKTDILHNNFANILGIAKTAERYPIGNCEELSSVIFAYLTKLKKLTDLNIELFNIEGNDGDHVFTVLGRDKNCDPMDYKSWGPNAVICDPWTRKLIPQVFFEHFLYDYTGEVDEGMPGIRPFDPLKQSLELSSSNILTLEQFKKLVKKDFSHKSTIETLLDKFHKTQDINEKQSIAKKILSILKPHFPPTQSTNSLLTVLIAQMNYFLYSKIDKKILPQNSKYFDHPKILLFFFKFG